MKYKPFAHQAKSLAHDATTPIVFDCSDPGCGKSAIRIWAFEKRRKAGGGAALILAPKSLLHPVWYNDFRKFAPSMKVSIATAQNREKAFADDADVYVTNHDAVRWVANQKPAFFKKFSELIIDESSSMKHATSRRSKAALKITKYFKHRSCMTGTPNGNTITDIWHQVALLDDGHRLGPSFYKFRESVCHPIQQGKNNNAVKWHDKEGAEEAVFGLLADIVIRHKFEDCVDIPPNHQYTVSYDMTSNHRKAYDTMMNDSMLQIKRGAVITAIHAGVLANKALQVSSGAVYETPEDYHVIDTGRYEMILDLIEAREHSLCIYLWKHQRDMLCKLADTRGITFAVIDGTVGQDERNEIVAQYQKGAYQVLFGHPLTVAHGLTLTKGTATIWASPTYNLEHFVQGSKRQHRIGQVNKTETIVVVAAGTLEEQVWDKMLAKDAHMSSLLELFATL